MKIFHCDHCQNLVFFENVECVNCQRKLAFLPDLRVMGSLEPAGDDLWHSPLPRANAAGYHLCAHYQENNVCNQVIPADQPDTLCSSCQLTRVIPDLSQPGNREAWYRMEAAKRRLLYTLFGLGLKLPNKNEDPEHGLAYEFRSDVTGGDTVLTGHNKGLITINIAEADDAEREKRRLALHEPYRTLIGHFRHEIGHYYWDRLIQDSPRINSFRERFGDEREDYQETLERYYREGAPGNWSARFISAYAAMHPWEDWAETWAHYLHMSDALETAAASGLSLRPRRADEPTLESRPPQAAHESFDHMIERWFPLTYVLNNLNRGMGLADAYPFVLSAPAIEKLRFVHDTIVAAATGEAD